MKTENILFKASTKKCNEQIVLFRLGERRSGQSVAHKRPMRDIPVGYKIQFGKYGHVLPVFDDPSVCLLCAKQKHGYRETLNSFRQSTTF